MVHPPGMGRFRSSSLKLDTSLARRARWEVLSDVYALLMSDYSRGEIRRANLRLYRLCSGEWGRNMNGFRGNLNFTIGCIIMRIKVGTMCTRIEELGNGEISHVHGNQEP